MRFEGSRIEALWGQARRIYCRTKARAIRHPHCPPKRVYLVCKNSSFKTMKGLRLTIAFLATCQEKLSFKSIVIEFNATVVTACSRSRVVLRKEMSLTSQELHIPPLSCVGAATKSSAIKLQHCLAQRQVGLYKPCFGFKIVRCDRIYRASKQVGGSFLVEPDCTLQWSTLYTSMKITKTAHQCKKQQHIYSTRICSYVLRITYRKKPGRGLAHLT